MNPAMIRIALLGSRSAWGRLAGIVLGVAIGTAMFLVLLGAYRGLERRDDRSGWMRTYGSVDAATAGPLQTDQAIVGPEYQYAGKKKLDVTWIAVSADSTVQVPFVGAPPAPGEYLASPAAARLIDRLPADQLGDRFGKRIGTIPASALESPDSLVILAGSTPDELRSLVSATVVSDFPPQIQSTTEGYRVIVIIGAIGMFFPVLLFISIVTQLGAAQRQERFAALRLIGASTKRVSLLAASETAATSLVGAILGVVLSLAVRPIAAMMPVNGLRMYRSDFAIAAPTVVIAILLMTAVSTYAAYRKISSAEVSATNTVRDMREPRPSLARALPLFLGVLQIVVSTVGIRADVANGVLIWGFILGFFLTLAGIVVVGPLLTYWLSRLVSRRAQSAATLIASRRISATPSATFRSVSGLVVAVFIVTVFAASSTSADNIDTKVDNKPGMLPIDAISMQLRPGTQESQLATLSGQPGIGAIVPLFRPDSQREDDFDQAIIRRSDAVALGFDDVPDTDFVLFNTGELLLGNDNQRAHAVASNVTSVENRAVKLVVVRTDGSESTMNQAITTLENSQLGNHVAVSRSQALDLANNQSLGELKVLAYLGAILSILIAGCSLAIATACALLDRKRVLGLMRLMGMPERNLRRIIAIEAAMPLTAVLGMVVALGFGVAWCIIDGTSDYSIGLPDRWYALSIAFGLGIALAMIAATFGLIRRNTMVTVTRFE